MLAFHTRRIQHPNTDMALALKSRSFAALAASGVDVAARTIYGAAAITVGEAKGHGRQVDARTLETVLAAARAYRTGVRVVNTHTMDVSATVGLATNWRIDGSVLRCDISFLESATDEAAKFIELASRAPDTFGLSITFYDEPENIGGVLYCRCKKLLDIAIVDEPAANANGLFSTRFSALGGATKIENIMYTPEEMASKIDALTAAVAALEAKIAGEMSDEMAAKLSALSDTVAALSAKVEKEVVSFGSRANALEQAITPKDTRAPALVKFESTVRDIVTKEKVGKFVAIARAAKTDPEGNRAWLAAGQPSIA